MEKPGIDFATALTALLAPVTQPLTLILHVGTPKTGTTSLQTYLDKRQRRLRGKGILYPHNIKNIKNPSAPKHQWFEKNLVSTHVVNFLENFKNIIAQVKDDTHTIILSSEGIYNYWWDFPAASKDLLSVLTQHFDVKVWVWFREPLAFIESYYKQCIRNPQLEHNPCYGKDLSFVEMLDIAWFAKHLDYQGFINECQALFGADKVLAFNYEGDIVQSVISKLGLATPHDNPTPRQNRSLNAAAIALLRTVNRYEVSAKDKELLIPHLKAMNEVLKDYAEDSVIDPESRQRVLALVASSTA